MIYGISRCLKVVSIFVTVVHGSEDLSQSSCPSSPMRIGDCKTLTVSSPSSGKTQFCILKIYQDPSFTFYFFRGMNFDKIVIYVCPRRTQNDPDKCFLFPHFSIDARVLQPPDVWHAIHLAMTHWTNRTVVYRLFVNNQQRLSFNGTVIIDSVFVVTMRGSGEWSLNCSPSTRTLKNINLNLDFSTDSVTDRIMSTPYNPGVYSSWVVDAARDGNVGSTISSWPLRKYKTSSSASPLQPNFQNSPVTILPNETRDEEILWKYQSTVAVEDPAIQLNATYTKNGINVLTNQDNTIIGNNSHSGSRNASDNGNSLQNLQNLTEGLIAILVLVCILVIIVAIEGLIMFINIHKKKHSDTHTLLEDTACTFQDEAHGFSHVIQSSPHVNHRISTPHFNPREQPLPLQVNPTTDAHHTSMASKHLCEALDSVSEHLYEEIDTTKKYGRDESSSNTTNKLYGRDDSSSNTTNKLYGSSFNATKLYENSIHMSENSMYIPFEQYNAKDTVNLLQLSEY